jgi:hypothetical protein
MSPRSKGTQFTKAARLFADGHFNNRNTYGSKLRLLSDDVQPIELLIAFRKINDSFRYLLGPTNERGRSLGKSASMPSRTRV